MSCLLSFKLIVPLEAASNLLMAAKLELSATSTMVSPSNGPVAELPPATEPAEDDDENELEVALIGAAVAPCPPVAKLLEVCDESCLVVAGKVVPLFGCAEIVSSKELNLVKFIIQPSILRASLSSLTFCHETFSVVDETASTMTSSGCPGREFTPSATPVHDNFVVV